jgi:hypothetical protein
MTPKELAQALDTDQRIVRKFLRDTTPEDQQPGQGGRWNLDEDLDVYKVAFENWQPKGRVGKPKKKDQRTADEQGVESSTANDEDFEDFTELDDPELDDLFEDEDFEDVDE